MKSRLSFVEVDHTSESDSEAGQEPLCAAVHAGLIGTPKSLPCRFFYDHRGSQLFERITALEEYYLTRSEAEILELYADEIVACAGDRISLVEFGSGSSAKTRRLIKAGLARQDGLRYVPIDISGKFLLISAKALLSEYDRLDVVAVAAEYRKALSSIPEEPHPRLFLFLGSNLGNFARTEAVEFLRRIRDGMKPDDRVLVGVDLVKDRDVLYRAYNDSEGVTAEFNLNLLQRINQELGADFKLDQFRHHAPFDEEESRIEMRLVSEVDQSVRVDALETTYTFAKDEIILTEWSHKYTCESFAGIADEAGLRISGTWHDRHGWFAEFLLQPL